MSELIRFELMVAEVTSSLTAEHELAAALQRILDHAVLGLGAATGSLLMRADSTDSAALIATSGIVAQGASLHLNTSSGPAVECAVGDAVVFADDLQNDVRWPLVSELALQSNLKSARAYPVRLANQAIGALTLYASDPWGTDRPSHLAQTMADLAALAIGLERAQEKQESIAGRIRQLITDRVAVDQALGMLAQHLNVTIAQAQTQLVIQAGADKVSPTALALDLINDRGVLDRF